MRRALRRLWYLLRRRQLEAELAEEMAAHRAMAEHDLVARGVDPRDAAFSARRAFGSSALAQDRARDVWIAVWLQDAIHDLRFAIRMLARDRAFTIAVVLVLGIGVGVNTTQFTILDATCLRGLPIPHPDRVLYLAARDAHDREHPLSYGDFEDIRSSTRAFAGAAAFISAPMAIADDDRAPERVLGLRMSANTFHLLGVAPLLGRDLRGDDEVPGAPAVAIISHTLWTERYGADSEIVGRSVRVDGAPSTIVGVMPGDFGFPSNVDVWQPLALTPGLVTGPRDARTLSVFGRLRDDGSLPGARADLAALGTRLARDYPASHAGMRLSAIPINDQFNSDIHNPAWTAFTLAGILILLIACANAANLLLMRAVGRSHEIAVRASLGAGRFRIVRQLIVESALLAIGGGAVGLVLSILGVRLFASGIPPRTLPYFMSYTTIDRRILAVLIGSTAATVFVFGLAPALHLARRGTDESLKSGSRVGGVGRCAGRWMTIFLTAEFGLSMVLLAGVLVSIREARAEQRADSVVRFDHALSAFVTLPADRYPTPEQRGAFYRQLEERLLSAPGVERFAAATVLPLGGGMRRQLAIGERPVTNGEAPPLVDAVSVTAAYFDVIGVALNRGRPFDATDGRPGHDVAIVNQAFADQFFAGAETIGQRIRLTGDNVAPATWLTIVGVAPNVRQRPQSTAAGLVTGAVVYLPLLAAPPATAALLARTHADPAAAAPELRDAVRELDADLPIYRLLPLEDAMQLAAWNARLSYWLVIALTFIALSLSVVGLYAVTAHGVAQRTRDIGIRVALGATTRTITAMVLARAFRQMAYGFVAGIACAMLWGPASGSGWLSGMTAPVTLGSMAAVLAAAAVVASVVPARRAARIDPAAALRCE